MNPEDNLAKRLHKKKAITAINLPTIPKKPDSKKSHLTAKFQLTRKLQEYNLPFLIENDFHFHPEVKQYVFLEIIHLGINNSIIYIGNFCGTINPYDGGARTDRRSESSNRRRRSSYGKKTEHGRGGYDR